MDTKNLNPERCPHLNVSAELHAGAIRLECPRCGVSLDLRQAEVLDAYRKQIGQRLGRPVKMITEYQPGGGHSISMRRAE